MENDHRVMVQHAVVVFKGSYGPCLALRWYVGALKQPLSYYTAPVLVSPGGHK